MPTRVKLYIYGVVAAGAAILASSLMTWSSPRTSVLVVFTVLVMLASAIKLRLPALQGTYSLSFPLLLFGIIHFSLPETLIAGCAGVVVQSLCNTKKRSSLIQVLFNTANLILSVGACFLVARGAVFPGLVWYRPAGMALVVGVFFVFNTVLVSGVLALLHGKPLVEVCREWYFWSFPYYLIGAAIVALLPAPGDSLRGEAWLILLPLLYLIHFFLGLMEFGSAGTAPAQKITNDPLPRGARYYLSGVLAAALILLIWGTLNWQVRDPLRFGAYLALVAIASTLKVRLPRMRGTISLNFVLLLVGIGDLSLTEVVFMSALAGAIQCLWKPKRPATAAMALFNAACLSLSAAVAWFLCRWALEPWLSQSLVTVIIVGTLFLYACNTLIVSTMVCLVNRKPLHSVWRNCHFWSFPYYLVGAAAAGLMIATGRVGGWEVSLLVLPLMALVYISYRLHMAKAFAVPSS